MVIKPLFNGGSDFSEGLAFVSGGKKVGYINTSGKMVIQPAYDGASRFEDGIARVYQQHKMGYIDTQGDYIWDPTDATLATKLCAPPF